MTPLVILSSALVASAIYITYLHVKLARMEDVLTGLVTGQIKVITLDDLEEDDEQRG